MQCMIYRWASFKEKQILLSGIIGDLLTDLWFNKKKNSCNIDIRFRENPPPTWQLLKRKKSEQRSKSFWCEAEVLRSSANLSAGLFSIYTQSAPTYALHLLHNFMKNTFLGFFFFSNLGEESYQGTTNAHMSSPQANRPLLYTLKLP